MLWSIQPGDLVFVGIVMQHGTVGYIAETVKGKSTVQTSQMEVVGAL